MHKDYMTIAINEANDGIFHNHGGPFGAVVVKDGHIIGKGHNRVLLENNPTRHGEMVAIKNACDRIESFDLTGATLYTTAEPCLMCLGACLWANIETIYYGCSVEDTNDINFRDEIFEKYLDIDKTKLIESGKIKQIEREACLELFKDYLKLERQRY